MMPQQDEIKSISLEGIQYPSKTYKIEMKNDEMIIKGYTDGMNAVKQAVQLILCTERFIYPIYSWNYGIEIESLTGKDIEFVIPEIKRRISEALTQDDRVTGVENFKFTKKDDELYVEFEVSSIFGSFNMGMAVNI